MTNNKKTITNKQEFLNRLNTKMDLDNIFVREYKENCFEIRCDNILLETERLAPSSVFIEIITKEALDCFGVEIKFNNINNLFWVNL